MIQYFYRLYFIIGYYKIMAIIPRVVVAQSLSRVQPFITSWTVTHQASLSCTISQSLLKLMSIESVVLPNHLILCLPLLLLPSFFPSIMVFSNESALHIRWPQYWSFSLSISPSNEYSGLISFRMDWLDLLAVSKELLRVFSNTAVQKHQFFGSQLSLSQVYPSQNVYTKSLLESL